MCLRPIRDAAGDLQCVVAQCGLREHERLLAVRLKKGRQRLRLECRLERERQQSGGDHWQHRVFGSTLPGGASIAL
eukprot:scaffold37720_cov67-Phaeocystis_antarctica.AAC.12